MSVGLILFAHGARDPAWARPFEAVADAVRAARPALSVRLAYLELMAPDLPTAGTALATDGCNPITVLPLFLGAGGHVRRDLPRLLDALRGRHPDVDWRLAAPIGEWASVVQAMAVAAVDAADDAAAAGDPDAGAAS
jgi:sirohydrochlorin cobaltochelatase